MMSGTGRSHFHGMNPQLDSKVGGGGKMGMQPKGKKDMGHSFKSDMSLGKVQSSTPSGGTYEHFPLRGMNKRGAK